MIEKQHQGGGHFAVIRLAGDVRRASTEGGVGYHHVRASLVAWLDVLDEQKDIALARELTD